MQYSVSHAIYSNEIRKGQAVRRLPSVIIIGVKKCGTRALLEYMKLHPAIKAPGPEPHFFDRNYHLGLDWYRSKMPLTYDDEITVEKTPRYFVTPGVPERIFNMSNVTKLLLVTRDPVVRAMSDFTQSVSKGGNSTKVSFTSRVLRRNGKVNTHSSIVETGLYVKYMQQWLHIFGKKNIHLVSGENLINNPIEELEKVQDFIGVERKINKSAIYFNATRGFPCIYRRDKNPSHKCFGQTKGRSHIHVGHDILKKLYDFYSIYNQYFFTLMHVQYNWTTCLK
ncbi:heparan sulfate glucosamine 3-O-sulfotransferase 2-like [Dreissena polymorpha]|uniref:heparan sulfate glucosamine 3-O-sulfotransferase 2-like n=1 Tax=Dreissena polymorpha TaxID=45954 RepID=UPI002264D2D6|nr:heparan sulfate glucosamine 3-O-sulfotransferase 2-like [Dreissena polymorpha]